MRIGIFGGSFNPPHLGHLRAARHFAAAHSLNQVLIIPAGTPPLKQQLQGASDEDRLELCRLTFSLAPFEVCDWELRREGLSYTIDTLKLAREKFPQARLFLLIGTDQQALFHQWHGWQSILELAELVVLPRAGQGTAAFQPLEISSSKIRSMLARCEDVSQYLAPGVLEYITKRGLYDTRRLP